MTSPIPAGDTLIGSIILGADTTDPEWRGKLHRAIGVALESKPPVAARVAPVTCSSCGKNGDDVIVLVNLRDGFLVCDECIYLAQKIVIDHLRQKAREQS